MVSNGPGKNPSGTSELAFDAVVGQRDLKEGLLAVAVADGLDGLLVRGEKGTAKSTTVRALADLLPDQRAVADCPYGCPPDDPARQCEQCRAREDPPAETRSVPLVTLPLGATRDRVVGALSVADALAGEYEFDPGLLARANRGILYVDEVNLLEDHLVDVLLDAAASGRNRVERDGVAVAHPAEFTLVGTMNPEEGDLRPQLRDRFALQTAVTGCEALDDRVTIIDRALGDGDATESSPTDGRPARERLARARDLIDDVTLSRAERERIAATCRDAGVEGHRGDIAMARAARAFAALDDRTTVTESDLRRAAEFALPHRLRSRPFEEEPDLDDVLEDHFEDEGGEEESEDEGNGEGEEDGGDDEGRESTDDGGPDESGRDGDGEDNPERDDGDGDDSSERPEPGDAGGEVGDDGEPAGSAGGDIDDGDETGSEANGDGDSDDETDAETARPLVPGQERADIGEAAAPDADLTNEVDADPAGDGRSTAVGASDRGVTVRTERAGPDEDVDAAASVRAAATRGSDAVSSRDLRKSVRAGDAETLVCFVVDASASMRPAMGAAKGVALELLRDAYVHRDAVSLVAVAGEDADVVLPPTDSATLAARHLKELPTGDRTPLPAGLRAAGEVIDRADPDASLTVVVTDGRANAADGSPTAATREAARDLAALSTDVLVVEADSGGRAGVTDLLVSAADARRCSLADLSAGLVDDAAGPPTET